MEGLAGVHAMSTSHGGVSHKAFFFLSSPKLALRLSIVPGVLLNCGTHLLPSSAIELTAGSLLLFYCLTFDLIIGAIPMLCWSDSHSRQSSSSAHIQTLLLVRRRALSASGEVLVSSHDM